MMCVCYVEIAGLGFSVASTLQHEKFYNDFFN